MNSPKKETQKINQDEQIEDKNISKTKESQETESQLLEIERKFLVKTLPNNLNDYQRTEITQGYLVVVEGETEVRIRQKGEKYYQTIKKGAGKTRFELEIEITEDQFLKLSKGIKGNKIKKTRFKIPHEGKTIELDIYHEELKGLVSAEIEFSSIEESNNFTPPEWLGEEVTEDRQYKNQHLAFNGIPYKNTKKPETKQNHSIPEYKLEIGLGKLVDLIKEKLQTSQNNVVVEIAGGSASGKTSYVADMVKTVFKEETLLLALDDYYYGKTFMEEQKRQGNILNWDQPEAINLELFNQHLQELKAGKTITKPVYDMKTSEPISTEELKPKKLIVVEGLFALANELKDIGDIKTFIDIGTHGRIVRRLLRDIKRTGQKPSDILKYFAQIVEPMHEKYIENTKQNADIIINNEYSPEVEAERSGLHEIQLKFKGTIDTEKLRKAGAEKISTTKQIDKYYNPKDRNLIKTGEILRIREENKKKTLTYKGPKLKSEFIERPKFEFEIDEEAEEAFLLIYGNMRKTITKERTFYILDGIVFSIDKVSKRENGQIINLGEFIEIRSTDKECDPEKIKNVIKKLSLDINNGIKESYFEM